MGRTAEVVIVGGGPAGAATAAALARRGREVLVLERATFPRDKLCGDFIHPLGVAALDRLGVLDEIRPRARALRGMMIVSPAGREVFAPFPAGIGLSVSRAVLDDLLLRAAWRAGAVVKTGRVVRRVLRRGDRWRITTEEGEVAARVLIGADGLRSTVAQAAGLRGGPPRRGRYAIGLRVRGLGTYEGFAEMHLARGAYCGVSAFPDGQANVTAVLPKATVALRRDVLAQGPTRASMLTLLASFPSLVSRLRPADPIGRARAIGPLAPAAGPVVGDGVLLVGDAAWFTDPLTGQGVSLALTGALVAAEVIAGALRAGDGRAAGLAAYAHWHRDRLSALRRFLRLVDWIALRSPLIEPLARAWQEHPALVSRFLSVIGHGDPVSRVLAPTYLSRLALACIWRA
ncbi:MAG: NAD(P)/FAD-dependent oxidoreductase [Armatimonadetes bacterium]|nr:NAD(P)/FAD-dependent oxidoreductase [Armatimonadota bacterium]